MKNKTENMKFREDFIKRFENLMKNDYCKKLLACAIDEKKKKH